jgi:hypothetical protein
LSVSHNRSVQWIVPVPRGTLLLWLYGSEQEFVKVME